MKLWSLTLEKVRQMENELEAKTEAMRLLKVGGTIILFIFSCYFVLAPGKSAAKGVLINSNTAFCGGQ